MPFVETEVLPPEQPAPPDNRPVPCHSYTFSDPGVGQWSGGPKLKRAIDLHSERIGGKKRGNGYVGGIKNLISVMGIPQPTISFAWKGSFRSTNSRVRNPTPYLLSRFQTSLRYELNVLDGRDPEGPVDPETLCMTELSRLYDAYARNTRRVRREARVKRVEKSSAKRKKTKDITLVLSPDPLLDESIPLGSVMEPEIPLGFYLLPAHRLLTEGSRIFLSNIKPFWDLKLRIGEVPIAVGLAEMDNTKPQEEQLTFSLPLPALVDPEGPSFFILGASRAAEVLERIQLIESASAHGIIESLTQEEARASETPLPVVVEPTPEPSVPVEDLQEALLAPSPSAVAKAEKRARKALAAPKDETQMENLEAETPTPEPEPVPATAPAPPDLLQQLKEVLTRGRELAYQLGPSRPDLDGPLGNFIAINAVIQEAK